MSEKEILYQMLSREISNILVGVNPAFGMFTNVATNYVINMIDPYVEAFLSAGSNINTNAAGSFIKEEINTKVDEFMKKFEAMKNNNDL
jgi:hypothetical protein